MKAPQQQMVDHESIPTQVPLMSSDKSWRVRVFHLSKDGKWLPLGTGQCQILHKASLAYGLKQ